MDQTDRIVHCIKLGKDLPGLEDAPWPDDLGDRIWAQVSAEAWQLWLEHQKMLLNEYRLNPASDEGYKTLHDQCEAFFFGGGSEKPPEFKAS
jgi:Fe-S cluster biosynthesis and repair protein YggX